MEQHKSLEWMIKEVKAGNTSVFRAIFDEFREPLFRFVRSRVESREDALDLLQDTFIDLWGALRSPRYVYNSDRDFSGFLYMIARRKIARLYRFRRPHISLEESEVVVSEAEEGEAGEVAILMRSLETLNDEDQEVIKLRYFSGLSFAFIANLMGKKESAVKVRHHRALEKLKQILGYDSSTSSES